MADHDPARDRVVAVTGAGTGIGQATAVRFGALGWCVAVGGRRVEKLAETAALVVEAGGTCIPHALDVADPASVEEFFSAVEADVGTVTAVVNNAATARYGPLDEFSPAEIEAEVATKLLGSLYMARRGIEGMRRDGVAGDIHFVTSLAGHVPWPLHQPYAAANAGVEHAARTLRIELEGSGIRVSVLRCGETSGTDFSANERQTGRAAMASREFYRYGLLRHGGLMQPEMVADAIVTAVTLPRELQYSLMEVTPLAPVGELPRTYDEFVAAVTERYLSQAPRPT